MEALRLTLIMPGMARIAVLNGCLSAVMLGLYSQVYAADPGEITVQDFVIDDRRQADLSSKTGTRWRLVSDQVMGGVSRGTLKSETIQGRACLHMRGLVSTKNSGGFIQIALDYEPEEAVNAADYSGLKLDVLGNGEQYSVHLRTRGLSLPWQSYRASFQAETEWRTITLPFSTFRPYKTSQAFKANKLKRIGLVAIGRDFEADVCLASIGLYR